MKRKYNHQLITKKIQIALLLCFACMLTTLNAQDYKADLEKSVSVFTNESFEVEMEYLFFPSHTAQQAMEKESIHMRKSGDLFHLDQFGQKVVYNDKHVLLIDDDSQILAIDRKKEDTSNEPLDPQAMAALNKAVEGFSASFGLDTLTTSEEDAFDVTYLGVKNGKKGYAFHYKTGIYEKLITYIDNESKLLCQSIIYYRESMEIAAGQFSTPRLEINYRKQIASPDFDETTFDIMRFVSIKKDGAVLPKGKYKDYTLINHLQKLQTQSYYDR